jgi:Tol biopolymer transport system component
VYVSATAAHSDIWLIPIQTGILRHSENPIRLTNGPLPYTLPCPSRDGKQIFALGTKQRGELVRYDMKSKQFVPFLSGISATDPTFSRDGRWVAYVSYPDHILWRSRSDGSERVQLTYAPLEARFPFISPDGTKVAFHNDKNEVFLIPMKGGTPQKILDNAINAAWSPDGNYLYYQIASRWRGMIIDLRTGTKSAVPSSEPLFGFWLNQNTLIAPNEKGTNFLTFNLRTGKWTEFERSNFSSIGEDWMISPDGKYMYFTTAGGEAKAMRLRFADRQLETITSLKDLHRAVVNDGEASQINVAPDGSPIFTRDTGYQEIYALNMRWP